mmetsp:Transcript_31126/g.48726  ORF Transcript_31126/g.48726 Transcript_31126/m.48726 type:complete len:225 (+) Transcript_31126:47-721(+)
MSDMREFHPGLIEYHECEFPYFAFSSHLLFASILSPKIKFLIGSEVLGLGIVSDCVAVPCSLSALVPRANLSSVTKDALLIVSDHLEMKIVLSIGKVTIHANWFLVTESSFPPQFFICFRISKLKRPDLLMPILLFVIFFSNAIAVSIKQLHVDFAFEFECELRDFFLPIIVILCYSFSLLLPICVLQLLNVGPCSINLFLSHIFSCPPGAESSSKMIRIGTSQ